MEKVLKYKTITPNNILRWYESDPGIGIGISTLNPVEYGTHSVPVFISNEPYNLYLNFEKDFGILDATQFVLVVEDMFGNDQFIFPFSVNKYKVNGIYQLYLYFKTLKYYGIGRFKLIDGNGTVWFKSQTCLFGDQFVNNTNYFEFSNDRDLGSFYYSTIETLYGAKLYQRVRLIIANEGLDIDQEIKQYRNASNRNLRNVNFDTDLIYKLKGYVMAEDDCIALSLSFSPCKEIYVNGIGMTTKSTNKISKKENTEGYTIEMNLYLNGTKSDFVVPGNSPLLPDIINCNIDSNIYIKQTI